MADFTTHSAACLLCACRVTIAQSQAQLLPKVIVNTLVKINIFDLERQICCFTINSSWSPAVSHCECQTSPHHPIYLLQHGVTSKNDVELVETGSPSAKFSSFVVGDAGVPQSRSYIRRCHSFPPISTTQPKSFKLTLASRRIDHVLLLIFRNRPQFIFDAIRSSLWMPASRIPQISKFRTTFADMPSSRR